VTEHLVGAAEVARILGVSRQRVAQLVVSAPDFPRPEVELAGGRVWSRRDIEAWAAAHPDRSPGRKKLRIPRPGAWAPAVQRILELAAAQARELNHAWVGEEHLVLALLHPECPGMARQVLQSFGLSLDQARAALVESLGDPFEPHEGGRTIPPRTQLLLERANLKAVDLQDDEVTSEHVLLALVDDPDRLPPLLSDRRVDAEAVRNRVVGATEPVPSYGERKASKDHDLGPVAPQRVRRPPELELAPTPQGLDPHRRRPWGSAVFHSSTGEPARQGVALRQYLIDRDGNPVLTTDGRPVHLLIDDEGRLVLDEEGQPILTAVDVPEGSEVRSHPRRGRR
jgi:predicted DNA-binding transcriptional regulator AlpA